MEINRRQLLGSTIVLPFLGIANQVWASETPCYVTTGRAGRDRFNAYILNATGLILNKVPLAGRGHGACVNRPRNLAVVFARRPESFAVVLDLKNKQQATSFAAPDNRHFCGHGVFSKSGQFLYATENDFGGEKGVIGIYDALNNFRRIGEYDSGGIGPHEVILAADGKMLIVANGGILTHPDFPRQKLNLPDMKPTISFINPETGKIIKSLTLTDELHQVSLRHLSADLDGNIWVGGQYQGSKMDDVPLLFKGEKLGHALIPIPVGKGMAQRLKHYIGSVAVNGSGTQVAFSAPRGNLVSIWDTRSLHHIQEISYPDICGIAQQGTEFLISAGDGSLLSQETTVNSAGIRWDNHLISL